MVRPTQQFRHPSTGRLATTPSAVAAGYARFARETGADPEADTEAHVRALHARLDAALAVLPPDAHQAELDGPITNAEVKHALRLIRSTSCPGPDGIDPWLLVNAGPTMVEAMASLFAQVWETEEWPEQWTHGEIVYVLKSGDDRCPSDPSDHRPLSLLDAVCKVFERVVQLRLQTWLERMRVLSDSQNGFRWNRSVDDNLLYVTELARRVCVTGDPIYLVFLDVRQAYDRTDRKILFEALASRGLVTGRLYRIIRAMSEHVNRRVRVNGVLSDPFSLVLGVPQGSVLSPILFDLFFDPLVRVLDGSGLGLDSPFGEERSEAAAAAFADDLLLMTDKLEEVQQALTRAGHKATSLRAQFSPGVHKCAVCILTPDANLKAAFRQHQFHIPGHDVTVRVVDEYRYHGIKIGKLRPHPCPRNGVAHCLDWSSAVNAKLFALRSRASLLHRATCNHFGHSVSSMVHLIKSELVPLLDFAAPLMDLLPKEVRRLDKAFWHAVRLFLTGSTDGSRFPPEVLSAETGLLPWHRRRDEFTMRTCQRLSTLAHTGSGCARTARVTRKIARECARWMPPRADGSLHLRPPLHHASPATHDPRPWTEAQTAADRRWAQARLSRALWCSSLGYHWVQIFRRYGLVPQWNASLPVPHLGGPAEEIQQMVSNRVADCVASGTAPPTLKEQCAGLVRMCVWKAVTTSPARSTWSPRMQSFSRMRSTGWNLLYSGPTPHRIPATLGHPWGRLIHRLVRFNTLPVMDELRRTSGGRADFATDCPHSQCGCSVETVHHFVFECPAYADLREELVHQGRAAFCSSPQLLQAFLQGSPQQRMAIICFAGPPSWPSPEWNHFPIPLHGQPEHVPLLGSLLAGLQRSSAFQWVADVSRFLRRAWQRRMRVQSQQDIRGSSCHRFLQSLLYRASYSPCRG